jgi:cell division septation protein DedD
MRMCITVFRRTAILAFFGVAAFLALGAYGIALADEEEAARFEVTVNFNTSATQDDIDEVDELLRAYDEDLDFVVMEIWPPVGRALMATNVPDFCQTVEAELEAKSYVDDASCGSAAVETPVAPPPEVTATAAVAETPAPPPPVEETPRPVEETPAPVEETPKRTDPLRMRMEAFHAPFGGLALHAL